MTYLDLPKLTNDKIFDPAPVRVTEVIKSDTAIGTNSPEFIKFTGAPKLTATRSFLLNQTEANEPSTLVAPYTGQLNVLESDPSLTTGRWSNLMGEEKPGTKDEYHSFIMLGEDIEIKTMPGIEEEKKGDSPVEADDLIANSIWSDRLASPDNKVSEEPLAMSVLPISKNKSASEKEQIEEKLPFIKVKGANVDKSESEAIKRQPPIDGSVPRSIVIAPITPSIEEENQARLFLDNQASLEDISVEIGKGTEDKEANVQLTNAKEEEAKALGKRLSEISTTYAKLINESGWCACGVGSTLRTSGVMIWGHANDLYWKLDSDWRFEKIALSEIQPGDIVYREAGKNRPAGYSWRGHIFVYTGEGMEASSTYEKIRDPLDAPKIYGKTHVFRLKSGYTIDPFSPYQTASLVKPPCQ